ncbi:MAG: hypothetical protein NTX81_01675 [Candidatus Bathyarchaeota archaeon]|nr:hypothetical protein [Candidatus Bathyarchaeota archaeon]
MVQFSKISGKITEMPEELKDLINGLPVKPQMKEVLLGVKILENCRQHVDVAVCQENYTWFLRCKSLRYLLKRNRGRSLLYHELSHIIIYYNSPVADMYDLIKEYEMEERAWEMAECFMGRSSRYIKHVCLNDYKKGFV